jgi:hypothetical protein
VCEDNEDLDKGACHWYLKLLLKAK